MSRQLAIPDDGSIQMPEKHCDRCGTYTDSKCSSWTRSNCPNLKTAAPPAPNSSWALFVVVLVLAIIIAFAVTK